VVVVMKPDAEADDVAAVIARVEAAGGEAFVSRVVTRTIIGLVGDIEAFSGLNLRGMSGVADVMRVSSPYKLVSSIHHPDKTTVFVRGVPIGPDTFTLIAGPCAVETPTADPRGGRDGQGRRRDAVARRRVQATHLAPTPSKGSVRPGCASSPTCARQPGCRSSPRSSTHTTSTSSAPTPTCCRSAPATCRTSACCRPSAVGKPVMLKRGMQATIEEWLMAAEYIAQRGNLDIVLCERGIRTFETATRNTLDISSVPVGHDLAHLPVIVDPSHSGGGATSSCPLSRAAIAVGATASSSTCTPPRERARRRATGIGR
jgi:3-deoxy-7-phosphoheptulonate synthase